MKGKRNILAKEEGEEKGRITEGRTNGLLGSLTEEKKINITNITFKTYNNVFV